MTNTGIFGGSFNPVHNAHLQVARTTRQAFALDRIVVVPSADPPHKSGRDLAAAAHRFEMARLAFDPLPDCSVSDMEIKRPGPSYTLDTVRQFRRTNPAETLTLIMGLDTVLEIDTWHEYPTLLQLVPLIVVYRQPGPDPATAREQLLQFLQNRIHPDYQFQGDRAAFVQPDRPPIYWHPAEVDDISATRIREQLQAGLLPQALPVPPAVQTYLANKGLYQCRRT